MFTFHQSVIGNLHILKDLKCQDCSEHFSNKEKNYHIAVVADGHGDTAYFRSDIGAKLATEITVQCFKEFAEESEINEEKLAVDSAYRKERIKHLTDRIVSYWHAAVIEHYKQNPITPKEEELIIKGNIKFLSEKDYPNIYGTTLVAGLMLPKSLILIQQGDGSCEVFYNKKEKNGTYGVTKVREPITPDPECEGPQTTSLCDSNVAEKIRTSFVDLNKIKVIACYFSSDGVEKSYRDSDESIDEAHPKMGGVHTFYKNLSCEIVERNEEDFKQYLEKMLSDFSKNGLFCKSPSGDDISVAGIVDIDALKENVANFKKDIEIYKLEEEIFWKKEELKSKTRKHGILYKRCDEAYNKYCDLSKSYIKLLNSRKNKDLLSQILEDILSMFKMPKQPNLKLQLREIQEESENAKNKWKEAELNFNEFNKSYQKIKDEIKEIENHIAILNDPNYVVPQKEEIKQIIRTPIEPLPNQEEIEKILDAEAEEERRIAEEEKRRKAEEERRKAEEERRIAEEERRIAEEEKRKAEEERRIAEEERRKAEEERRIAEEERRIAEEERRKTEEERRIAEEVKKQNSEDNNEEGKTNKLTEEVTEEPTEEGKTNKLTEEVTEEPAEEGKTDEPNEEVTEEPAEEVKPGEPVEEGKTDEPAEEVADSDNKDDVTNSINIENENHFEETDEDDKTEESVEEGTAKESKSEDNTEEVKPAEERTEEPNKEGTEEHAEEVKPEEPVEEVAETEPVEEVTDSDNKDDVTNSKNIEDDTDSDNKDDVENSINIEDDTDSDNKDDVANSKNIEDENHSEETDEQVTEPAEDEVKKKAEQDERLKAIEEEKKRKYLEQENIWRLKGYKKTTVKVYGSNSIKEHTMSEKEFTNLSSFGESSLYIYTKKQITTEWY